MNGLQSLLTDTSDGNNKTPKLEDANLSSLLFVDNLAFAFLLLLFS